MNKVIEMPKEGYKSPWFISVVIAVITLLVFWRVLIADFVMWDDDNIIYKNPNIQGLSFDRLGKIFIDVDSMMRYNPLTLLGWAVTYNFCKLNPFWYHLGNWLLHGLNASLVFMVLRKLLLLGFAANDRIITDRWRITISAAIAAMLWSLHPLRVEPVAWCTDRTYCQSLFFLLLSLLFYLQASETSGGSRRHYLLLTISLILYIISLLSYAIVMTFFLVLLVLDFYPLGILRGNNLWWKDSTNRRILLEKVPFAAAAGSVALVTVCIRIASAGIWEKPVSLAKFGLFDRFMQAMYIWAYYIWRQWYPLNLSPLYTTLISFDPLSPVFIISAIMVIGMITLLILFRRRWPLGLALGTCYFVLLVPVLGIFEHPHYPCDRYSLIVSILWSILLAAGLANPKTKPLFHSIAIVLLIIVITGLGLLTFRQTHIWNNSVSLFEHMIRTLGDDPFSYDPHFRLGRVLIQQGQTDKAIGHFKKAIKIKQANIMAYNDLGMAYSKVGHREDAIEMYSKAIEMRPDFAEAHNNLGSIYSQIGRYEDAIQSLEQAVKIKPNYAEAYYNLGITFDKLKCYQEAIEFYRQAVKNKPNYAEAYNELGADLGRLGRHKQAIDAFNEVIKIDHANMEAYGNLGVSYDKLNRFEEAIQAFKQAIKISSDNVRLHFALGSVYIKAGDKESAKREYEILKTLDSGKAETLLALINKQKN